MTIALSASPTKTIRKPIYSMYAIYAYIDPSNHPNVGIYGIHGVYGKEHLLGSAPHLPPAPGLAPFSLSPTSARLFSPPRLGIGPPLGLQRRLRLDLVRCGWTGGWRVPGDVEDGMAMHGHGSGRIRIHGHRSSGSVRLGPTSPTVSKCLHDHRLRRWQWIHTVSRVCPKGG